jgi:tripartite-type tricarboxylate transporter receptor subunit TctC
VFAAAIFAAVLPAQATAQDYPAKLIRIIVGYPPGAGLDFTARLFADWLKTTLSQPAVVENQVGAGGKIAAEYVSHAPPDGYTLLYGVGSDLVWTRFLSKRQAIDPLIDLTPIASVISSVNCVAVNAEHPLRSFQELIERTKQNPGKLTYGTAGIQSYYYLIGEALRQQGLEMLHVPYKGTAPLVPALLGREIDVALTTVNSVAPQVVAGSIRILALMQPQRYAALPDIPTIKELLPSFNAPLSWFGLFGPPGMPAPTIGKLSTTIGEALASPQVRDRITGLDLNIFPTAGNELRALTLESTQAFEQLIKTANIKPID